jgi:UDP-glucose 6-dehydrogenase
MDETQSKVLHTPTSTPAQVCVVGGGYVGLTSAASLAELGHRVRCLESNPGRLAMLKAGRTPIEEPLGAGASTARRGVGLDERIGGEFLRPGPDVGGSCLPDRGLHRASPPRYPELVRLT